MGNIQTCCSLMLLPSPDTRSVILAEPPSVDDALAAHTLFSHLKVNVNAMLSANVTATKLWTPNFILLFHDGGTCYIYTYLGTDESKGAGLLPEPTDSPLFMAGLVVPSAIFVGKVVPEAVDVR